LLRHNLYCLNPHWSSGLEHNSRRMKASVVPVIIKKTSKVTRIVRVGKMEEVARFIMPFYRGYVILLYIYYVNIFIRGTGMCMDSFNKHTWIRVRGCFDECVEDFVPKNPSIVSLPCFQGCLNWYPSCPVNSTVFKLQLTSL
jgi:hypothetical protein